MVNRLPESWIPLITSSICGPGPAAPQLSEQRCEWQQRIQATLYHHGCPQRRQLMTAEGREWLDATVARRCARKGHGRA